MKRARVAYRGLVHDAVAGDNGIHLENGSPAPMADVVWLPPVDPGAIYTLHLNYADQAHSLKEPQVFLKSAGSLCGHLGTTRRPAGVAYMRSQCELAVVMGASAKNVKPVDAYEYIAGYTVANNYAMGEPVEPPDVEPDDHPTLCAMSRDSSTPLGPWIVDRDQVPDPMNLALRTLVNGKVMHEGNTRDMIFDIPALIEYLSGLITLQRGDVILTGTPRGFAAGSTSVQPGDVVVTEIEGIGQLMNTVT